MSHYKSHIFFCTNIRASGKRCCHESGASEMCSYAKKKVAALELGGKGGVRISSAGCLGRCELGPVIVVYPEGVWYSYSSTQDIDEIIESHIIQGKIVERLLTNES